MCVCVGLQRFRSNSLSDAANQLKNISRAPYQTRSLYSPQFIVKEDEDSVASRREKSMRLDQRKISFLPWPNSQLLGGGSRDRPREGAQTHTYARNFYIIRTYTDTFFFHQMGFISPRWPTIYCCCCSVHFNPIISYIHNCSIYNCKILNLKLSNVLSE